LAVVDIGLDPGVEDQDVAFDPSLAVLASVDRTLGDIGHPDRADRCSSAEMDRESTKFELVVVASDSKGTLAVVDPYWDNWQEVERLVV
jgi:hypothetical protein